MSKQPILTNYVSEMDSFLQEFDKKHPKPSASQEKEIVKYRRIYRLRDIAKRVIPIHKLWKGF